jgi:hypothetical protein
MVSEVGRWIYLVYFVSHIPITCLLDLQGLFGAALYPNALQGIFKWYIETHNDVLMAELPLWLRSFLFCEAFFQLPFFFMATYALLYRCNWVRIPMIIYGSHVATTVVPILATFIYSEALTDMERLKLLSFYIPYLLIPLALVWEFSINNMCWIKVKTTKQLKLKSK